ncbi:glucosyltransferase domain-containing protein [Brucella pseudogrignonensis]|uniref:glucosyltransferase domain-containing protein n=1 Tax=Brucella pseudogrignonensis TaxID=419475 RepID=UPI003B9F5B4A
MTEKNIRWYMAIFAIVYILPIILANKLYIDDTGRSTFGGTYWEGVGRPLASWIYQFINFNAIISDLSPMSVIAAAAIILGAGYHFSTSSEFSFSKQQKIIVACSFLASPFLLEVLSYKYDAPLMALSILCASYSSTLKFDRKRDVFFVFALILSLNCIYQAAINVYIGLVGIKIVEKALTDRSFYLRYMIGQAASSVSALIVYATVIAPLYTSYLHAQRQGETLSISDLLSGKIIENFVRMNLYAYECLSSDMIAIIVALTVATLITVFFRLRGTRLREYIFTLIGFVLIICSISGLLIVFRTPSFHPRVFMGTLPVAVSLVYFISNLLDKNRVFPLLIVTPFVFTSYAYGNALTQVKEFDALLASRIASALDMKNFNEDDLIVFSGREPILPSVETAGRVRPIIPRMAVGEFNSPWFANIGFYRMRITHHNRQVVAMNDEYKVISSTTTPITVNSLFDLSVSEGQKSRVFFLTLKGR